MDKNVEEKIEFKKKIVILAYVTPWHPWVKRVSQLGLANIYTYIYKYYCKCKGSQNLVLSKSSMLLTPIKNV